VPNTTPHLPEVLQAQLEATAENNAILTELRVSVARLIATQEAEERESKEWRHAIRNSLQTFVPRAEISERFGGVHERIRTNEGRIKDLEDNQRWATRRLITTWIGLIGAGATAIAHKLNLL
jgi:hypothetical protein